MKSLLQKALLLTAIITLTTSCATFKPQKPITLDLTGHLVTYKGKYAAEPGAMELIAQLPDLHIKALADAQAVTGYNLEKPPIYIELVDTAERATCRTATVQSKKSQIITLPMDHVLVGTMEPEKVLTHEMIHAVMRVKLDSKYAGLPTFFREGMAVWGAGQLESRAAIVMAAKAFQGRNPLEAIDGIEDSSHDESDYLEDGLMFVYLEGVLGRDGIQALLAVIERGIYFKAALTQATGDAFPVLKTKFTDHAEADVQKRLDEGGWDGYMQAYKAYKAKDHQTAIDGFAAVEKAHPGSFAAVVARYWRAKSLYVTKQYEEAARVYQQILEKDASHVTLVDDSQYRLAKALTNSNQHESALAEYERLFDLFGFAPEGMHHDAKYFQGKSLAALKRHDEAKAAFELAIDKSKRYRVSALYDLGLLHIAKGNLDAALELADQLEDSNPKSALAKKLRKAVDKAQAAGPSS